MPFRLLRGLAAAAVALSALVALPAMACHSVPFITVSNPSAGEASSYTIQASPNYVCTESFNPGHDVLIQFPADYNVAGVTFDAAASSLTQASVPAAFPANGGLVVDAGARTVRLTAIQYSATWQTNYFIVLRNVVNPTSTGNYFIPYQFQGSPGPTYAMGFQGVQAQIVPSIGIDISANPPKPALYAEEIRATATAPVTLTNSGSALNLRAPLSYNFSAGEVRYARFECSTDMRFAANTSASYTGGGSASVGAVNGLGTSAVHFSITANDGNVDGGGYLMLSGDRQITSTQDVTCTYGLYDYPSQAASGGSAGRVASVTGPYLAFGPSTAFTTAPRTSTADVEADPAYSRFLAEGATTATTAALARLTYGLASPVPRKANGTAITLVDLHATGATGTKIVVDGDFNAAANADGSYTGAALSRVYLSTSSTACTLGTAASTLSADRATFNVGATATDRMLCLVPRSGVAIPAADYLATLDATSANPAVYDVPDIGPLQAGRILRNGTQIQAPLVQTPDGWLSRIALTNTGNVARAYTVRVIDEEGNATTVNNAGLSGTIAANSTKVVSVNSIIAGYAGNPRATILVTVSAPNNQIQGLYQIVNPSTGSISNHVMVRPGTN
jgi:hypothetical protein